MTEQSEHHIKTKAIHRDPAFAKPDMSVFISTALFGVLGAFFGRYIGKSGEMNVGQGYRGLSTLLGTVMGAISFGGVAGYSAMRESVKEKMESDDVRASEEKALTVSRAEDLPQTHAQRVEHQGPVKTDALNKAL
ncbi:MAG: hypothetical protein ACOYJ2_02610 [Rickettsiales bacterium]